MNTNIALWLDSDRAYVTRTGRNTSTAHGALECATRHRIPRRLSANIQRSQLAIRRSETNFAVSILTIRQPVEKWCVAHCEGSVYRGTSAFRTALGKNRRAHRH